MDVKQSMEIYLLAAALAFDTLIGDPRVAFHPVVLIGKLIAWLEKQLYSRNHSDCRQKAAGGGLGVFVLSGVYGVTWLFTEFLHTISPGAGFWGSAFLLSFTISPRSLAEAGLEIKNYLQSGDLSQARYKVGWIVGRDTENLSTSEITRATVETVAENIVDGIISPLFYAAIGGVPLAFMYRAVNTLDSMVGYKNERYINFGMIAARVDDIFNYIPARLNGVLLILAAFLLGYQAREAARAIKQDAAKHPSPNSGIAEAGVAGALGIRLGGLNYYGGVASPHAVMGHGRNELKPAHISQTIKIMYTVTLLFITILLFIR
jgi:adenosylcobinamide-phosphate synthase